MKKQIKIFVSHEVAKVEKEANSFLDSFDSSEILEIKYHPPTDTASSAICIIYQEED